MPVFAVKSFNSACGGDGEASATVIVTLFGGVDLGQFAACRIDFEPAEEFGQRRTVADVRLAHAFDFQRILAGLGQLAGVAALPHFRARARQPVEDRGGGAAGIGQHTAAFHGVQCHHEPVGIMHPNRIAQMRQKFGRALGGVQEQVRAAIVMQDRKRQGERRVRHVMAAHVQKPADRIRQRDDGGFRARFPQGFAQLQAFCLALLAGQIQRVWFGGRGGRAGLIGARAGAAGGAWLLKRPEDITLDQVLRAVDGCAQLGCPPPGARGCPVGERIPRAVARAIVAADEAVTRRLSEITVADLLSEPEAVQAA